MTKPTIVKHVSARYPLTEAQANMIIFMMVDFHVWLTEPDLSPKERVARVSELAARYSDDVTRLSVLPDEELFK